MRWLLDSLKPTAIQRLPHSHTATTAQPFNSHPTASGERLILDNGSDYSHATATPQPPHSHTTTTAQPFNDHPVTIDKTEIKTKSRIDKKKASVVALCNASKFEGYLESAQNAEPSKQRGAWTDYDDKPTETPF